MSVPFDHSIEFEDRSGGARIVVSDDKTAQLQITGHGAMRRSVTANDLEELMDLALAAFNVARTD